MNGQNYDIKAYDGTTINDVCSGTFSDSNVGEAPFFNYDNNENYTVTFCAASGSTYKFDFTQFSLRNEDKLYIYDGPNTSSPLLGVYTDNSLLGSIVASTGSCITFNFISDGLFTRPGWSANIICDACPPIVTSPISPSTTEQCAGTTITYSVDLHAGSTYTWTVSEGTPASSSGLELNSLDITWNLPGLVTGTIRVDETSVCGSVSFSEHYVDIYPLPTPLISGPANVCPNTSGVTYSTPPSGNNFSWVVTGGTFSGSGSSITVNWGATGPGTVRVTETDISTGCSFTTADYTVLIQDVLPPVVSDCPGNINISTTPGICSSTATWFEPTALDNCDGALAYTFRSHAPGSTFNTGTTNVTYTFEDASGNISTCSFNVVVTDSEDPVAVCQDISVILDAFNNATITGADIDNGSSDNCGLSSLTVVPGSFTDSNLGPNPVVLTVTDINGNTATCNAVVTVLGNTPPVALCKDITVFLDATGNATITGSDIDNGSNDPDGIASLVASHDVFTCANVGPNTVTLTVTDNAGLISTCTSIVTIADNILPLLTCPGDISVNTDAGVCGATVSYTAPVITDNCSGSSIVTMTSGLASGSLFPVGTTTNTFQVTDPGGNTTTCSFTVTVADNEGPVITLPAPPVISAGAGCQAPIPVISAIVTDNCTASGSIIVTQSPVAGTMVGIGVTIITITAVDLTGNSSVETINVTVYDGVAPVIITPANVTANLDASCQAVVPDFLATLVVTDNCPGVITTSQTPVAGSVISGVASTNVQIQATDAGGNTSSVVVLFITEDNIAPVVSCKDATLYLDAGGNAALIPADITLSASDNCGSLSYTLSKSVFTCTDVGVVPVILTVSDGSLNTATCNANVTVVDNLAPVVNVKTFNLEIDDITGTGILQPSDVDNGTTDNCGLSSLTVSPNTFDCGDIGTQNVTLTATDTHGNTASQSVNITVSTTLKVNSAGPSSCNALGPFSRFSADVEGGTAPYNYFWDCLEPVDMFVEITFPVWPFFIFSNESTLAEPYFNNLVPDGLYNIQLTVTDNKGCAVVFNFTFNKSGAVVEDNITENYSTACYDEIKTYTVPSGATSYSWNVDNGVITGGGGAADNFVTVQWGVVSPGTVTAGITKPNILGFSCTSYIIENVTLNPNPAPAFNAYPASACENSVNTYTLDNFYSSHNWTVTNGTITGGGGAENFVQVRWGAFAAGTVIANVTNASGCTGSVTASVTINALPSTTLTSSDADNTFCSGTSITFTAAPGGTNYQFRVNTGSVQNGPSNTYTTSALSNGQIVDVVVTSASSCSATSAGITNTVVSFPVPTLTSSQQPLNTFCAGTNVTFTAGGGTNFDFRVNNTSVQNSGSPTYTTAALTNGQTVDVVVSNATGCSAVSAGITNTVVASPIPTLSSSDADNTFCAGTSVTFTAGGGTTYNFRVNGISVQNDAQTTFTTTTLADGAVVDVLVSNGTCSAPSGTIVNNVIALPVPTLTDDDADNIICAGTTVIFTAGGGTSYNFRVNSVSQYDASDTYITSTLANGQVVDVIVTNAGGCSSTSPGTTFTVTTPPTVSISYAGSPYCSTTGPGQAVTLTGPSGGTYAANPVGLSIDPSTGAINPVASTPGSYTVTYILNIGGGCPPAIATTPVAITLLPVATFGYLGSPYCSTAADPLPTFNGGGIAGTFSSIQPGLVFINVTTGEVDLSASTPGTYDVVNTIAAFAGCGVVTASSQITIAIPPTATISFSGSPFCSSVITAQSVTLTGTGVYTGGTFSESTGNLSLNATTGSFTPSTSLPGTYTVTYTLPASPCVSVPATTSVTVTAAGSAIISYSGSPYCTSDGASKAVTLTGTTGGTFSASPAGLTLDPVTGAIIPNTSSAGSYTVTYSIPGSGGCPAVMATAPVTITAEPTAAINYVGSPFCTSASGTRAVTLTGTGAFTGGTYNSAAGLSLNTTTGEITPSASTAGTYTVTYTTPVTGGCAPVLATTSVVITALPTAMISYAGNPFCTTVTTSQPVTMVGTAGGTYSAVPAGLSLDTGTGEITPSTSIPATYTVTYTIATSGGCGVVTTTANVTITALPTVTISYTGATLCTTLLPQTVTINGTGDYIGGTFTAAPGGLSIDAVSGLISPASSTPGNYIVTYDTGPSGGCASVLATTNVAIEASPVPTISGPLSACIDSPGNIYTTEPGQSSYLWNVTGGSIILGAGTNSVTVTWNTPGIQSISVNYTSPGGCSGATPPSIAVTIDPLPTVTVNSPAVCEGTPATVIATPGSGGTYSYAWTVPGTVPDPGDVASFTTTVAGTYSVVIANTATTCVSAPASGTVTLDLLPTVTVNSPAVCEGTPATVTATPGSAGTYSYAWTVPGTVPDPGDVASFTTTVAGTYSVVITNTATTCVSATASGTVTVNPLPAATIEPAAPAACEGTALPLTATPAGGSGTYTTHTWTGAGAIYLSSTSVVNPTFNNTAPVGSYALTYTVTDDNGCIGTATTTVIVNSDPAAPTGTAAQSFCAIDSPTVAILTATGTAIQWYSAATGGTPLAAATVLTNGSTYYASQTAGSCESDTRFAVTVTIDDSAAPTGSAAQIFCAIDNPTVADLVAVGTAIKWYNVPSGGSALLSTDELATGNYYASQTLGSCESNTRLLVAVTVNPALPVSVSISPDANPACVGTTVIFTATPVNGGTTPSYQWYIGVTAVGTNSATYSYVPADGDVITVVLTSSEVCQSGGPATSNAITMGVSPVLPVSVSITSDANNVCAGTTVNFTATPVNGGSTPAYQWYNGSTAVGTNSATYSYVPANGDVITVVLTSGELCQSGGPATSNSISITVTPSLPVSVSIAANASNVCAGTTVTFTATPVNGGSTPAYQWYNGTTQVGTNSPTYSYIPVNGDVITVILTSDLTCQSGGPATSNAITMAVNPILPVSVSIAADVNPVCTGASVTFTAAPVNGGAAPSYQWYNGTAAVGTNSAEYSYFPADGDVITVVMTSAEVCQTGSPATSNAITMAVSSSLSLTAVPVHILCRGSATGSIDVTVTGGTAPYSYTWTGTGIVQGSEDQTGLTAGFYTVVAEDANNCQSAPLDIILTEPLTNLSGTISSQTNALCAGSADGSVTVEGGGGVAPYEYKTDEGAYQSSGTFAGLAAGSYTVTVRDANLCTSDVIVTITEPEDLEIDYTTKPSSCPDVPDGNISLTISGGTPPYNVIWSDGLTSIDRANIPDGTYSVIVTDANGCAEALNIVLENTGSSACVVAQELITPNNDGFNDTWKIRNIELFPDAEVFVYNRWGQLVFKTKNISDNEWDGTENGKPLPTDSYHYILYLNDGSEPRSGVISIIR